MMVAELVSGHSVVGVVGAGAVVFFLVANVGADSVDFVGGDGAGAIPALPVEGAWQAFAWRLKSRLRGRKARDAWRLKSRLQEREVRLRGLSGAGVGGWGRGPPGRPTLRCRSGDIDQENSSSRRPTSLWKAPL